MPKRYPASARVIFDVVRPDPVTGLAMPTMAVRGYTQTQIELISDFRVAGDVVDKLGWLKDPNVIERWQRETGGTGDMRRWAAQQIIDNTKAKMVQASNILEITYTGENPAVATKIVANLRDAFIDATLRYRTDSAGRTAGWYAEQTEKARRLLTTAEAARTKFERDNGLVISAQGEAETLKLQALQNQLMTMRSTLGQQGVASEITVVSPAVDQLQLQLANVDDQLEQAKQQLGTSHPTYKALVQRRELAASALARQQSQARAQQSSTGAALRSGIGKVEADYTAQKDKVLAMQPVLNQLQQLQRDVALRQGQFDKAAERSADLKLESDVAETGLVPLGDATGSPAPTFPNMPLIGFAALAAGLVIGILTAILLELFNRRVRSREDLAFAAKTPVLAVIAGDTPARRGGLIRRLLSRSGATGAPQWQPAE